MFKKSKETPAPESVNSENQEQNEENAWPKAMCMNPFPENQKEKAAEIQKLHARLDITHKAYVFVNIATALMVLPAFIANWGRVGLMLGVFTSLFLAFEEVREGTKFSDVLYRMVNNESMEVNYDETALIAMRLAATPPAERNRYKKAWNALLEADANEDQDAIINLFPRFGIDNSEYKKMIAEERQKENNGAEPPADALTDHPDLADIDKQLVAIETINQLEISKAACESVAKNPNANPEWKELAAKCDELITRVNVEGLSNAIDSEIRSLADRIIVLSTELAREANKRYKDKE